MSELSKEYFVLFNGITDLKSDIGVVADQLRQVQINAEESFVENSTEKGVSKEYSILFHGISDTVEALGRLGEKMDHLQVKAEDAFLDGKE